ncbi:DUF5615 family PIN-like protein [Spirosoma areae]
MAQLLADENIPFPVVEQLRLYGHTVQTILQLNLAGQAVPDDQVLALATSLNCCLLTLNKKDFIKLHNQQPTHAGIWICTVDPNFTALAERIHVVCLTQAGSTLVGQLLRVQRPAL